MTRQTGLLTAASRRAAPAVLLPLLGGNLLLFVAALAGLKIPDSHTWQLALSLLLVLGLVSGLLLWNAVAIRCLRAPLTTFPLWRGALLLGAWLLLALLLFHVAGSAEPNIDTRAGYWNSQLSAGLRKLLPYTRLVTLQGFVIAAFRWVFIPAVLVPAAIETATFGLHRPVVTRALRVLLSASHWAVAVVGLGCSAWLLPALSNWHPTHSVGGEVVSAALRLGAAGLLCLVAVLFLLAVDAELLEQESFRQRRREAEAPSTER